MDWGLGFSQSEGTAGLDLSGHAAPLGIFVILAKKRPEDANTLGLGFRV